MRKVILFIAMSLDGYIADIDGGVAWLHGHHEGADSDTSYCEFTQGIDTVLMGWNTYHQIITELSVNEWVYSAFTTYVFTHNQCADTARIRFTDQDPAMRIKQLKQQDGKDIWLCGGADLIGQVRKAGLIDQYHISVIPTLLGQGIRLFEPYPEEVTLTLTKTRHDNGIAELIYERRNVL